MKKFLCVLIALALIATSIPAVFAANNEPSFELTSLSGAPGDTVSVKLKLVNNPGITSLRVAVSYDASCLKLISVNDLGLFDDRITNGKPLTRNPMKISWYASDSDNYDISGELAELKFQILENAETSSVTLGYDSDDVFNIDGESVSFSVVNGRVTVTKNETESAIARSFLPNTDDNNASIFNLPSDIIYSGLDFLGAQKKNIGNSIRFVSVLSAELIDKANDYGYVLTSTEKTTAEARANIGKLNINNGHLYSCKNTINKMTGGYGDNTTKTDYKYVTCAVNNIKNDRAVAARFYIETDDGVYYAEYSGSDNVAYKGCVARCSEFSGF